MLSLVILYFIIGIILGITGIGGILAIPGIIAFVGASAHVAIATALASFFLVSIVGTVNFRRMGLLDKNLWLPLCAGTIPAAFAGAWGNAFFPASALLFLLGLVIIFAGVSALHQWKALDGFDIDKSRHKSLFIAICGVIAGVMAGLTGAGGPIISIPLMIALGIPPLPCVAASMPMQLCTTSMGSVGNALHGNIDMSLLLPTSVAITVGLLISSRIVRFIPAPVLKKTIAILCLLIGVWQCLRAFDF